MLEIVQRRVLETYAVLENMTRETRYIEGRVALRMWAPGEANEAIAKGCVLWIYASEQKSALCSCVVMCLKQTAEMARQWWFFEPTFCIIYRKRSEWAKISVPFVYVFSFCYFSFSLSHFVTLAQSLAKSARLSPTIAFSSVTSI